jgi:hypothetical protein
MLLSQRLGGCQLKPGALVCTFRKIKRIVKRAGGGDSDGDSGSDDDMDDLDDEGEDDSEDEGPEVCPPGCDQVGVDGGGGSCASGSTEALLAAACLCCHVPWSINVWQGVATTAAPPPGTAPAARSCMQSCRCATEHSACLRPGHLRAGV